MLLAVSEGRALATLDPLGPEDGLAAAIVALRSGRSAEAPLRHAVASGGRLDPAVRLALAVARPHPAAVQHLARLSDPAPLTSALAVAEAAGPQALLPAIEEGPLWVAGRLVLLASGLEDPSELPLAEAVRVEGLHHPGDAAQICRAWLHGRLAEGSAAAAPELLSADCYAARILAGDRVARAALVARWPELAVTFVEEEP